jgi:hypothetical protein
MLRLSQGLASPSVRERQNFAALRSKRIRQIFVSSVKILIMNFDRKSDGRGEMELEPLEVSARKSEEGVKREEGEEGDGGRKRRGRKLRRRRIQLRSAKRSVVGDFNFEL